MGIFGDIKIVFLKGLVKFMEIENFEDLVRIGSLKLVDIHQTVAHQPRVPFWGQLTVWWFSKTIFFFHLISL